MCIVTIKRNGCILQVSLNRPEKRNALNSEMLKKLIDVFSRQAFQNSLRLIYLSGVGSDFCVGADLQWMASSYRLDEDDNYHDADQLSRLYHSMHECPVPILTYIHGHIFGGGVGLCSASDMVIADHKSIFSLSEAKRGLIPAVMLPMVVDKLGKSRTRELLITGRRFSTQEGANFGLIHFVTSEHNHSAVFNDIIRNMISSAPEALFQCRQLLNNIDRLTRHDLVRALANKRASAEAQEGFAAFFEKRRPAWAFAEWSIEE